MRENFGGCCCCGSPDPAEPPTEGLPEQLSLAGRYSGTATDFRWQIRCPRCESREAPMKTYRNLWPQICNFENLYRAWRGSTAAEVEQAAGGYGSSAELEEQSVLAAGRTGDRTRISPARTPASTSSRRNAARSAPPPSGPRGASRASAVSSSRFSSGGSSTIPTPAAWARARIEPWTAAPTSPAVTPTS